MDSPRLLYLSDCPDLQIFCTATRNIHGCRVCGLWGIAEPNMNADSGGFRNVFCILISFQVEVFMSSHKIEQVDFLDEMNILLNILFIICF